MGKRKSIEKVDGGFIIEEESADPFAPPKRSVAKDTTDLAKKLGIKGSRDDILPFVEIPEDAGT